MDDLATILNTFRSESMFIQMAAGSALKAIGEPAVPGLIETLSAERDTVRASAARLLGEIPISDEALAAQVIDALTEATRDPFGPVRWYAAIGLRALAEHHPAEQAVPALIDLLEDDSFPHLSADRAINEQAARTLQAIDTPQARQAVDAWWAEQDDWF